MICTAVWAAPGVRTNGTQHDGWIELSDVEGMVAKDGSGKTINDAGRVKIKTCTKKVPYVTHSSTGRIDTYDRDTRKTQRYMISRR